MSNVTVPWSGEELDIALPDGWKLQQVARPNLRAASDDWPERLAQALNQPDTSLPLSQLIALRPNGRIAIIVEDITRHSPLPQILSVVMRELRHARVRDEQVEIVFANGMHSPMTAEQVADKLGEEFKNIAWRANPWHDTNQYEHVGSIGNVDYLIDRGVIQADLRILISTVCPHLQAGYDGGYRMLVPGCSHVDTIRAIQSIGIGRRDRQLVGLSAERNPMRRAIDAVGPMLNTMGRRTFAIQYLLDDNHQPMNIVAGDPIATQRMLSKQCSISSGIKTQLPLADVLITNAYPRDYTLWQTFKAIANTRWAVRPGGVIICLSRCNEQTINMPSARWPINPKWTRRLVKWVGPDTLASVSKRIMPQMSDDSAFFVKMGLRVLRRNPAFLVSQAMYEAGVKFPGLNIFGDLESALAAAGDRLTFTAPNVTLFTAGGTTFPVPAENPIGRQPLEDK